MTLCQVNRRLRIKTLDYNCNQLSTEKTKTKEKNLEYGGAIEVASPNNPDPPDALDPIRNQPLNCYFLNFGNTAILRTEGVDYERL